MRYVQITRTVDYEIPVDTQDDLEAQKHADSILSNTSVLDGLLKVIEDNYEIVGTFARSQRGSL